MVQEFVERSRSAWIGLKMHGTVYRNAWNGLGVRGLVQQYLEWSRSAWNGFGVRVTIPESWNE